MPTTIRAIDRLLIALCERVGGGHTAGWSARPMAPEPDEEGEAVEPILLKARELSDAIDKEIVLLDQTTASAAPDEKTVKRRRLLQAARQKIRDALASKDAQSFARDFKEAFNEITNIFKRKIMGNIRNKIIGKVFGNKYRTAIEYIEDKLKYKTLAYGAYQKLTRRDPYNKYSV